MVEDVYELVAGLEQVEAVLLLDDTDVDLERVVWPGTPVLPLSSTADARDAFDALRRHGADEATLVAGDAPDLPPLLIGKLHRALGSADVAVIPTRDGDLVALAVCWPMPVWVRTVLEGLDLGRAGVHLGSLDALRTAAPRRGHLSIAPGWHRVREPRDLDQLDRGLEGWDVTRALLDATRA